ncbi:MAG: mitofilin family membrane protein [Pseudomonadota bacterium]
MVDKDENANTETDATQETKTPPLEAVEAEIVDDTRAETPLDDQPTADGTSVEDSTAEAEDGEIMSDLIADGDNTGAEDGALAQADKGGFSPSVIFLAVLALIGVVATALWATGGNREKADGTDARVTAQTDANPSQQNDPSDIETKGPEAQTAPSKIANAVGAGAKSAAQSIDPDTVAQSEKTTLPAVPATDEGDGNRSLQRAAKAAAKSLTDTADTSVPDRFAGDVAEGDVGEGARTESEAAEGEAAPLAVTDFLPTEEQSGAVPAEPSASSSSSDDIAAQTGDETAVEGTEETANAAAPVQGGVKQADPEEEAADLFAADPQGSAEGSEEFIEGESVETMLSDADDATPEEGANTDLFTDRFTDRLDDIAEAPAPEQSQSSDALTVHSGAEDETIAALLAPEIDGEVEAETETDTEIETETAGNSDTADDAVRADNDGAQGDAAGANAVLPVTNASLADAPPSSGEEENVNAEPATGVAAPDDSVANAAANEDAARAVAEQFAGEIAALEESFEERTQRIADALEAERARAATQAEEIASLKRELDDALAANAERSSAEIALLRSRIDELQAQEVQKKSDTEQQTRALLSIISLQRAFDKGQPYASELNVLKQVMPGAIDFGPLDAAASTGAPTLTDLQERFPAAIRTTLATQDKGAKGPVGHVLRNLRSLVSVRPATPQTGDTPAAVISRAENALEEGRLSDTLRELDVLGDNASEGMKTWMAAARIRAEAGQLVARLNDRLLAGVSQ